MKKIASLFLLSIFLFNTMGYFVAFKAVQYQVKSEIKSQIKLGLNPAQLSIITIDKEDLKNIEWLDNGKEMRYKDELYDIVKQITNEKSILFYCLNDKQEESLFANLEDHINKNVSANKTNKNQSSKKISDNVVKLFFSTEKEFSIAENLSDSKFLPLNLIYQHPQIETNSPPPRFV